MSLERLLEGRGRACARVCVRVCVSMSGCVRAHGSVCLHSMTGQREAPREWPGSRGWVFCLVCELSQLLMMLCQLTDKHWCVEGKSDRQ